MALAAGAPCKETLPLIMFLPSNPGSFLHAEIESIDANRMMAVIFSVFMFLFDFKLIECYK
jgi:hypothetical protein